MGALVGMGMAEAWAVLIFEMLGVTLMLVMAYGADLLARLLLRKGMERLVQKTRTRWDDVLVEHYFFRRLAHLAPAMVIYLGAPAVFRLHAPGIVITQRIALIYLLMAGLLVLYALLDALVDIYRGQDLPHKGSIKAFMQVIKLVVTFFVGITVLSTLIGKSPAFFLGSLGAMTAVLMLIFRDSILGFVAGIQMSTNQMVQIGDWIEMPKYGADGDVIDISLTTVKGQNWDKTISTIPAYAMVSDSFKNWSGMTRSGGRRIKRAVYIDMTSITFLDEPMMDRFRRIAYLKPYMETILPELEQANHVEDLSEPLNLRRLTNIGVFRVYVAAYLREHPKIHDSMTFLVRHLPPTDHGLPIEIYVFSNDQVWANYEALQADIFDHILAIIPEFGLRVFQNPTGADFRPLAARAS